MPLGETFAFEFLTLSLCAITIIAHRGTKKVTTTYGGGLGVSILYLAFIIGVTWHKHWIGFAQNIELYIPADEHMKASTVSYAFCTNLCYFFAFILPIALIADPTRTAARAFAPMSSLASMMVLLVIIPFGFGGDARFNFEYLILGTYQNFTLEGKLIYQAGSLFYSLHLFNLLMAIGVGLTTPRYGGKGMISVGGVYGLTYLYIGIVTLFTKQIGHNGGIGLGDFSEGNFAIVGGMFGGNLRAAQAFFFAFVIAVMLLGTFGQDFGFKRGGYQFGNKKSGVWGRYGDYENFTKDANEKDWGKLAKLLPKVKYSM